MSMYICVINNSEREQAIISCNHIYLNVVHNDWYKPRVSRDAECFNASSQYT